MFPFVFHNPNLVNMPYNQSLCITSNANQTYEAYQDIQQNLPSYIAFTFQPVLFEENMLNQCYTEEQKQNQTRYEFSPSQGEQEKIKNNNYNKNLRPKKNVQSNISNQVFSYITGRHKSIKALNKILKQNQQKIQLYYQYIESFVKSKKKYLSRKYLGDICILASDRPEYKEIVAKQKPQIFSLDQFRSALGYLIFHYLRQKCTISVLTSMKLSSELRRQHLQRKRQILNYLEEYVRPDFKYSQR